MKSLHYWAAALIALCPASLYAQQEKEAPAQTPLNARYGGEIRARYYYVDNLYDKNTNGDDKISLGTEMIKLHIETEPAKNIEVRLGAFQTHTIGTGNQVVDFPSIRDEQDRNAEIYQANIVFAKILPDLNVTVGRQEILFGDGFLIGDGVRLEDLSNFLGYIENNRTDFDAVRFEWRPAAKTTAQAFAARVTDTETDKTDRDMWLYGLDIEGKVFEHQTPGFSLVFARDERPIGELRGNIVGAPFTSAMTPYTLDDRNNWTLAAAVRSKGPLASRLLYKFEAVHEWGKSPNGAADNALASDLVDLDAWGGYVQLAYALDGEYKDLVRINYTYLSGDNKDDDDNNEFDPLLESQLISFIFNAQTNVSALSGGVSVTSVKDWQFHTVYYLFKYAEDYSKVLPYGLARNDSLDAGSEIDMMVSRKINDHLSAEVAGGYFLPGDVWKADNNNPLGYNTSDDSVWGFRLTLSFTF